MKAPVFFLYLWFFLLTSGGHVLASGHVNHFCHSKAQAVERLQVPNHDRYASVASKSTLPGNGPSYFANEDAEDEDTNEFSAKKAKIFSRYYSWPDDLPTAARRLSSSKAPSTFGQASYKYIFQRVLRV